MLSAAINYSPKQELVSQAVKRMIVTSVTPESDLVQGEIPTTKTRVEMRLHGHQTTETGTSRPWATSWFSSKEPGIFHKHENFSRSVVKVAQVFFQKV